MTERKAKVEDYIVRDVQYIPHTFTVREATKKLISTEFHGMPVCEDSKLVGFITAKELLRAAHQPDACVLDIIRHGTYTATPNMDLDDAARILFRYGLRNLPVVDEEGNADRRHLQPRYRTFAHRKGHPEQGGHGEELPGDQARGHHHGAPQDRPGGAAPSHAARGVRR